MTKIGATLLICLFFIMQCSSPIKKERNTTGNLYDPSQSPIKICGLEGFTISAAEHIIDEVEQPFFVKEIKGRIVNSPDYGWTKDVRVLVEIRGIKNGHITKTYADEKGDFIIKKISDGQYCFKATVLGWQSVMGIIIVSKKANPKNEIAFEMVLGK